MILLPAIDLYGGKVVRLTKGDYAQMTVYHDDPAAQAAQFQAAGARWLHTVDLEGAKDGSTPNFPVIEKICRTTDLKVEIGGGIRSLDTIQKYLDAGVERVILGTKAVTDPAFLTKAVARFGDHVAVGVDIKEGGHRHPGLAGDRPGERGGLLPASLRRGRENRHLHRCVQGRNAGRDQCGPVPPVVPGIPPGPHRLGRRVLPGGREEAPGAGTLRGHPGQGPVHRGAGFERSPEGNGGISHGDQTHHPLPGHQGRPVVKGVNFLNLQDVSNPVKLADYYSRSGADELVFYDITASFEGRKLFTDILTAVASTIFIPLTVGGGINSLEDFERVLSCGADKVSVNSGAIKNPELIGQAAKRYGDQCVVLSVDAKRVDGKYHVFLNGGRVDTGMDALEWIREGVDRGAGEVVVNSIDTDGVKGGFDLEMLRDVSALVKVPIIASGGAGGTKDFVDLFQTLPQISAGLAASIFHFGEVAIPDLKAELKQNGVCVRL